jgi:hypothetical protein
MEIISQGRVGTIKRWYRRFFLLLGLFVQQNIHPLIYHATYSWVMGHYTYLCKLETIFPTPNLPLGTHSLSIL